MVHAAMSCAVRQSGLARHPGFTAQDIADGLAAQGLEVDRRRIELEHPIKTLGFHSVAVRLHPEVHAEVKVNVVAE